MVKLWQPVDWPAPKQVRAIYSLRQGGVSQPPFDSLNLGLHVSDDPDAVLTNRAMLQGAAKLPQSPYWLNQVHSTTILDVSCPYDSEAPSADAMTSRALSMPLAIMTADCLPVLLCDQQGDWIAAIHAGWRGLVDGIIEKTVAKYPGDPASLVAWLGPCIGPEAFEVGKDVRSQFLDASPEAALAFVEYREKYLANLPLLAQQRLASIGVMNVTFSHLCTYTDAASFFSYRRDGVTGRMASIIWLSD
ncbi:peptidoglycan editing factor PgeF [Corallincola luteus]|uniref:peptidoglycan editing factor PgeF n=1 Tax=Corallincola luteus TaxID=1775177 RepID=UPI001478C227|nr:peptidoglycan editing factor PgeF [Corallincola luteus]